LASLLRDGAELVTNIKIANDKREVDRRIKEAELRDGQQKFTFSYKDLN